MAEMRSKELIAIFVGYLKKKTDLELVYGENALPYGTIARWSSIFKEGRTNVKDAANFLPLKKTSALSKP
jgi:hypothetical protein